MSALHDDPVDLLALLVRLRERCGPDVYRRALGAARAGVAKVVLDEARRLVGMEKSPSEAPRFPTGRSSEKGDS